METLSPITSHELVSNSSMLLMQQGIRSRWSKEENKTFENALAFFDEHTPNRWFKVAAMIPGKSVLDVMNQYMELVADVNDIEAGLVPIPAAYFSSSFRFKFHRGCRDQQRKKGVPWTEDEHRRFLVGLKMHGKGDWKNISRNYVVSKTPTQVASHAQKYYLRQVSGGKDKRRQSIHDMTAPLTCSSDKPNHLASVDWNHQNYVLFDSAFADPFIQTPFNEDCYIDACLI